MKKNYSTPKLSAHGSIEELTQSDRAKTFGSGDGILLIVSGVTPPGGSPGMDVLMS